MKLLILTTLFSLSSWAVFPPKVQLNQDHYQLVGNGLLEYDVFVFSFELYNIALYAKDPQKELVTGNQDRFLELRLLRDIEKKHLQEGWKVGLKEYANKEEFSQAFQWLLEKTPSTLEGDVFKIVVQGNQTKLILNQKTIAESTNPQLKNLVFLPWIGKDSVDEDLRNSLLKAAAP